MLSYEVFFCFAGIGYIVASEVVKGVAIPTGGFKNGAELDEGRIPKGLVDWFRPNGVLGRGDGVLRT